jgi:hypothetical protein
MFSAISVIKYDDISVPYIHEQLLAIESVKVFIFQLNKK